MQAWDFVDATVLWQTWQDRNQFLSMPVHRIDFGERATPRIRNACSMAQQLVMGDDGKYEWVSRPIVLVADMLAVTEAEWMRTPNFGRRSLDALKQGLAKHGLELRR